MKMLRPLSIFLLVLAASWMMLAQIPNQRLILKDGSYQIVKKYEVVGDRVRYVSAERGGDWEELPMSLVDWPATQAWAKSHAPGAPGPVVTQAPGTSAPTSQEATEIDKEAKAERDEELARSPTILPGLHLPDVDGVFILDTFHDQPELIEIPQNSGGLNTSTPHNVLKSVIPMGGNKQVIQLEGYKAKVQVHVNQPVIYVSLDDPNEKAADDRALVVDTGGAGVGERQEIAQLADQSLRDRSGAGKAGHSRHRRDEGEHAWQDRAVGGYRRNGIAGDAGWPLDEAHPEATAGYR